MQDQTRKCLSVARVWRALLFAAMSFAATAPPASAQSANTTQFLFNITCCGQAVSTYSVNQTTGELTIPSGVSPVPMRAIPALSENGAVVNSVGTFLFVASQDSNANSSVSVFSIAATGALTELAASPFSAADATIPEGLAISPSGQYLYASSASANSNPNSPLQTPLLDVYSIGTDGTLTPLANYVLPFQTLILYMHPTGKWLYVYGEPTPGAPTIQEFTVAAGGTLTNSVSLPLPYFFPTSADALAGDSAGKYVFSLRSEGGGGVNLVDFFSVNGSDGSLTLLTTFTPLIDGSPGDLMPAYEAVDSSGQFLFTSPFNFVLQNGIPLQTPPPNVLPSSLRATPLLLTSHTSPFFFSAYGTTNASILASSLINSDGSLTPAPGSPYTVPLGTDSFVVTGGVAIPTEPILTLSTNSLTFPSTPSGQTATASVTLSSTGFSPLLINTISISGDAGFTQTNNCPLTSMAAGAMCTVNLKFSPTLAGTFAGALNISSNAPSAAVSLSGTAPAIPEPDIVPSTLTFSSTTVGVASASHTIAIENLPVATATFQVTGIAIGGSNPNDFSQTNNCTSSIPIGGSCTITVTFTPLATGGRSATLSVATSTPGGLGALLNGTGAAPTGPALSVTQSQQTGAAGSTFTFPINESGFSSPPTLSASCAIPNGTCSISGMNLVVTTKPRTAALTPRDPSGPLSLIGAFAVLLLVLSVRTRRVLRWAVLVGGLALLGACQTSGSGGGSGANTPTGTPAGTYLVTIQAVSGSQTAKTTVSVMVQ